MTKGPHFPGKVCVRNLDLKLKHASLNNLNHFSGFSHLKKEIYINKKKGKTIKIINSYIL